MNLCIIVEIYVLNFFPSGPFLLAEVREPMGWVLFSVFVIRPNNNVISAYCLYKV